MLLYKFSLNPILWSLLQCSVINANIENFTAAGESACSMYRGLSITQRDETKHRKVGKKKTRKTRNNNNNNKKPSRMLQGKAMQESYFTDQVLLKDLEEWYIPFWQKSSWSCCVLLAHRREQDISLWTKNTTFRI